MQPQGETGYLYTQSPEEVSILWQGMDVSAYKGTHMHRTAQILKAELQGKRFNQLAFDSLYVDVNPDEILLAIDACRNVLAAVPRFRQHRRRKVATAMLQVLTEERDKYGAEQGYSS